MENLNIWAILCAAASAFVLGGFWYSEKGLGKIWKREAGMRDEQYESGHGVTVFVISFLLSLVSAFAFAIFLGANPPLDGAIISSLVIGFCFVATSFGINYLFSKRSVILLLIDGGYHIVQFVLYGVIVGLWH